MQKENRKEPKKSLPHIRILQQEEKLLINDKETGSKAIVPIQVDKNHLVEVVQIDGGLITGLPERKAICDNLIFSLETQVQSLRITWLIELKGTQKSSEVQHAVTQIIESIEYLNDSVKYPEASKYLKQRDYVFAAVAGAPDKTLPIINNDEIKALCKKLNRMCGKRKEIKNMFSLFCYIKPNKNYNKAVCRGSKPPYEILCSSGKSGYIPYPSMLLELLK
ncbi:MAG: hypothetical protein J6A77_02145 [Lachnospiraceae bacterium]|nr:hypothetical protein [Lachnospiraceae bacterium]